MSDERLSPHFWLSEFTRSDLAAREGIDNTPPAAIHPNLLRNAAGMEQIRAYLSQRAGRDVVVHVLSGVRVEAIERILCARDFASWCTRHAKDREIPAAWREYFERKRHPRGLATDFVAPSFGPPELVCEALAESPIKFFQLIFEHTWAHVGWPADDEQPKREILTLVAGGYAPGIVRDSAAA